MGFPSLTYVGVLPSIFICLNSLSLSSLRSTICRTLLLLVMDNLTHATSFYSYHEHDHDEDNDLHLHLTNSSMTPLSNTLGYTNILIGTSSSSPKVTPGSLPLMLFKETALFTSNTVQNTASLDAIDANFNSLDYNDRCASTIPLNVHNQDQHTSVHVGHDDQPTCSICLCQVCLCVYLCLCLCLSLSFRVLNFTNTIVNVFSPIYIGLIFWVS